MHYSPKIIPIKLRIRLLLYVVYTHNFKSYSYGTHTWVALNLTALSPPRERGIGQDCLHIFAHAACLKKIAYMFLQFKNTATYAN